SQAGGAAKHAEPRTPSGGRQLHARDAIRQPESGLSARASRGGLGSVVYTTSDVAGISGVTRHNRHGCPAPPTTRGRLRSETTLEPPSEQRHRVREDEVDDRDEQVELERLDLPVVDDLRG